MRALKHAVVPYILAILALFSFFTRAQTLSERAIYERCYSRLVRQTPLPDDPYIARIETGAVKGADACRALLNLAQFSGDRIPMYSTEPAKLELAKRVLASMQELHVSWFHFKHYEDANACFESATNGVTDPHEPALMLTKAMFSSGFKMDDALTTKANFRAIRETRNPGYSIYNTRIALPLQGFPAGFRYIDHGDLLGVGAGADPAVDLVIASRYTENGGPATKNNYPILKNNGGGIIGSPGYINANFGMMPMQPNLESMPRNWAKYLFSDLLCRELPVIKESDAAPYQVCATCAIKPAAAEAPKVLPFRRDRACVQCHASMDQAASLVRHFRPYRSGTCRLTKYGDTYAAKAIIPDSTPLGEYAKWGYVLDESFHMHKPTGRFMFRTYRDALVDKKVDNLQELGAIISELDDYYVCAAKRYYQYFTGIDVQIAPMTAAEVNALPPDKKFYYQRVVGLGLKLKSTAADGFNRDPSKLVEAIFALPEYKQRDFDLIRKAQSP